MGLRFQGSLLDTPLGLMRAVADEAALYLLEFTDLQSEKEGWGTKSSLLLSIEKELRQYFAGSLREFKTPLFFSGSPFQRRVWEELRAIPYGKTVSYSDVAASIGKPTAYRAVAQANGANRFAIVVPCHRVIQADGKLGGYASGLARKEWLIHHEKQIRQKSLQ